VGTYEPASGETACLACPPGSFCPNQGAPAPQACPAGTFNPNPSGTSAAVCAMCPAGTTSAAEGAASCPTQCAAGCDCPAGSTAACPAALPWAVAAGGDPSRSLGSAAAGPQGLGVVLTSAVLPAAGYTPVSSPLALGLSGVGAAPLPAPVAFIGRGDRFTLMSTADGTGLCEYPPGGGGPEFSVAPVVSPSGLVWVATRTNLYAFDSKSSSCTPLLQIPAAGGAGSFAPDALNLARSTLIAAAAVQSGTSLQALNSLTGASLGTWQGPALTAGPLLLSTAAPTVAVTSGASVWCFGVPSVGAPSFASVWPPSATPLTLPGALAVTLGAGPPQAGSPLFAFATATQVLYALAAADGSLLWSQNYGGLAGPFGAPTAPASAACAAGGVCALYFTAGAALWALNAATGATLWTAAASGGGQLSLCAVGSNGFVFAAAREGLYGFTTAGATLFLEPALAAPLACALNGGELLAVQPGAVNPNILSLRAPPTPPMPGAAAALSASIIAGAVVGSLLLAGLAAIAFLPALRAALAKPVVRRIRRVRVRRAARSGDADVVALNTPLLP
jgi:outer membrane protein assembly factor BamB